MGVQVLAPEGVELLDAQCPGGVVAALLQVELLTKNAQLSLSFTENRARSRDQTTVVIGQWWWRRDRVIAYGHGGPGFDS